MAAECAARKSKDCKLSRSYLHACQFKGCNAQLVLATKCAAGPSKDCKAQSILTAECAAGQSKDCKS